MADDLILLHLGEPLGWIALTQEEYMRARERAVARTNSFLRKGQPGGADKTAIEQRLVTADEAARALAVDVTWLMRKARERAIPSVAVGKYVRFDVAEVIAFLRGATDAPTCDTRIR